MIYVFDQENFSFIKTKGLEVTFIYEKMEAHNYGIKAEIRMLVRYNKICFDEVFNLDIERDNLASMYERRFYRKDEYQKILDEKNETFMEAIMFEVKVLLLVFLNNFNRRFNYILEDHVKFFKRLMVTDENIQKIVNLNEKFNYKTIINLRRMDPFQKKGVRFAMRLYEQKI